MFGIKTLRNRFRSLFPQLSERDFEFAKNSGINVDKIEARNLKGAELNQALCRSALTGSELPLNWWEQKDAAEIHARVSVRLPALAHLDPSVYGKMAQEGKRGFIMAAQAIGSEDTYHNVSLMMDCDDTFSFLCIESRLELR